MNPTDLQQLGVTEQSTIRLTSPQGAVQLGVKADHEVLPGSCFYPEHFNEPPVKDLMDVEADSVTGVPYFKATRVKIEKVDG